MENGLQITLGVRFQCLISISGKENGLLKKNSPNRNPKREFLAKVGHVLRITFPDFFQRIFKVIFQFSHLKCKVDIQIYLLKQFAD